MQSTILSLNDDRIAGKIWCIFVKKIIDQEELQELQKEEN
jgi:hypothetical protein